MAHNSTRSVRCIIDSQWNASQFNSCMQAIKLEKLDVVQVLENYEHTFQSVDAKNVPVFFVVFLVNERMVILTSVAVY